MSYRETFRMNQRDFDEEKQDQKVMIKIVYFSEIIDNWGRTESSMKGDIIYSALNNVEEWTDDMVFEDDGGRKYLIDELAGKQVQVTDIGIFTVPKG